MEKEIRIDQKIFNKNKPDRFALQQTLKLANVNREYKIDGVWTEQKPQGKPEGARVVFDSVENFRSARDTCLAWQDIVAMGNVKQTPELPIESFNRLFKARTMQEQLTLFVPWGAREQDSFGESELYVIDRIAELQKKFYQRNIPTQVLFMSADLYATEINNKIPVQDSLRYFSIAEKYAQAKGFFIKRWSMIKKENQGAYAKKAEELTEEYMQKFLSSGKLTTSKKAAEDNSGYITDEGKEKAKFAYLRERICEAEIIESVYNPIKVSPVAKNKDNEVDRDLPRVYIVPDEYQFPWKK